MLIDLKDAGTGGETWNGIRVIRLPHGRWETTEGLHTEGWCVEASTYVLACDSDVDIACESECKTKLFEPKQVVTCREICLPYVDDGSLAHHDEALGCAIGECIDAAIQACPDYELLLEDAVDPIAAITALETAGTGLTLVGNSALLNYAAGLFCCDDATTTLGGTPTAAFSDFPITGDGETLVYAVRNPAIILGPVEVVEGPETRRNRACVMTIQTIAFVWEPCGGPYGVTMQFCGACC